ncbi:MAG TPA: TerC family protein [Thermomicrobiales bacterium]|nr:TerC family protein [Thermomicrobiales bacterium]
MDLEILQKLFSIIVVDLVLSGDNAVVIGMAARRLSAANRKKAIIWGGAGAIVLRVIFTAAAALLLDVPLLQAIGGILLIFIAFRLVSPEGDGESAHVREADSLGQAIQTIILADVVMSLDNIIAVGGTAEGHLGLLLFGLIVSISLILFGSNLVAMLLQRYPWLLLIGVLVLVHAAVKMFLHDGFVADALSYEAPEWLVIVVAVMATALVLGAVRMIKGGIAGFGETAESDPHMHEITHA